MGKVGFGIPQLFDQFYRLDSAERRQTQHRNAEFAAQHPVATITAQAGMGFEVECSVGLVSLHFPLDEHSDEFVAFEKNAFRLFFQNILQGFDGGVINPKMLEPRWLRFVLREVIESLPEFRLVLLVAFFRLAGKPLLAEFFDC